MLGEGFRIKVDWMGEQVETLADIPPQDGSVLLVGINPSPVSVAAGHYYQGTLGKRLWGRLRRVGLLEDDDAWEDESFVAAGNGLTDIIKRPTPSADDLRATEIEHGADVLRSKLSAWEPSLAVFAFKLPAEALLGVGVEPGPGPLCMGVPTFRLAAPYARTAHVLENERDLRRLLGVEEGSEADPTRAQLHLANP